ncbi:AI-2E family transporter [Brevibacterium salitolerans]|jgi:predicted PurR-regulated permease PerM|uniref:AI-2E family transporter n=1 Tax=Brevibacterium salitolerans TaxID=1403566 RepID=A0ABN2W8Z1_9MICO
MAEEQRPGVSQRLQNAWRGLRSFRGEPQGGPLLGAPAAGPLEFSEPTEDELGRGAYEPYVSPSMRLAAAWSWRGIVVVAAIGVAGWLLSKVSVVVMPALIALLLAALLSPLNGVLVRKGWPKALAAATVFVGFIVLVAGLLALVGQQMVVGFQDLWGQVVKGFLTISDWLNSNPFGLDSSIISEQLDAAVDQGVHYLENNASNLAGGAAGAVMSVGSFFTALVLTLFTAFFLIKDGRQIFSWGIRLLPEPARAKTEGALLRGWQTLVQYVRVQIIVAGIDAIGIGLGAFILGLPLVIPLTLMVFIASFVPIVGAVLTGVIAVLVALVSDGFVTAIIMLAIVLAVQQIESNVLQPLIMGRAVSVHPLAVVLAVAAGGFLAGILGMVFAVPAVAVANTVVKSFVGRGDEVVELDEDPETDTGPAASAETTADRAAAKAAEKAAEAVGARVPEQARTGEAADPASAGDGDAAGGPGRGMGEAPGDSPADGGGGRPSGG